MYRILFDWCTDSIDLDLSHLVQSDEISNLKTKSLTSDKWEIHLLGRAKSWCQGQAWCLLVLGQGFLSCLSSDFFLTLPLAMRGRDEDLNRQ